MKNIVLIISIIFILISQNACVKKECEISGSYNFIIPATLTPAKDTFRIGDTITISSTFSDQVYDQTTDQKYELIDFKFYPGTEIVKIDTITNLSKIANYFEIIVDTSYNYNLINYNNGSDALVGQFNYESKTYSLEYQLVTLESGLFYLEYGLLLGLIDNQSFSGKCSNISLSASVEMNNKIDNNISFLNDSPNEHYNTWILEKPEQRFHKFGGYSFYVE